MQQAIISRFKSDVIWPKLESEHYCVLPEYHKYVIPPLTWMVGPTMNLISGVHHSCERREHAFIVLWEYTIISLGSPSRIKTLTTQSNHTKPLLSFNHHSNTLQKHQHTFLLETYTASTQKEKPINANCYIRFITKCRYSCKLSYHIKPILFHQELPTTTSKKSRSPRGAVVSKLKGRSERRVTRERKVGLQHCWLCSDRCVVWRVRWHWVEKRYISLNAT